MKLLASVAALISTTSALAISEQPRSIDSTLANHRCQMIAGADVNCHYCDNLDCRVVAVLKDRATYNFDCLCPNGQDIDGIPAWDHNPDLYCWVWANATDYNCPTVGSNALPLCAFCSK